MVETKLKKSVKYDIGSKTKCMFCNFIRLLLLFLCFLDSESDLQVYDRQADTNHKSLLTLQLVALMCDKLGPTILQDCSQMLAFIKSTLQRGDDDDENDIDYNDSVDDESDDYDDSGDDEESDDDESDDE